MESDNFPIEADVLVPNIRHAGFDGDTFTAVVRQNFPAVFCRLAIEYFKTRHRNNAYVVAELFCCCQRVLQFASTRKNNQIKLTALFFRSEEHTSELQSQSNLVCRLLL